MKKQTVAITLSALSILLSSNSFALRDPDSNGKNKEEVVNTKAANCAPATAKITMAFNDVRTIIEQGGSMWQNRATGVGAYEIPKNSGLKVIFAGALWMGGKDASGQLKLAGLRFRNGNDFWPGPLTITEGSGNYNPLEPLGATSVRDHGQATIAPDQCIAYDKFYSIRKAEVIQFINHWEACSGENSSQVLCDAAEQPSNDIMNRIYSWPAHGDASRGQDRWLAPFYDHPNSSIGTYDPDNGDYPFYDDILGRNDIQCGVDRRVSLYGDETYWWVFNDNGNIHGESNGEPIGMEVRAQAFTFATNDEVNRMTFYNYELINRGTQELEDTYFAQYIDADVGNPADDYTGCDVSRGLGYMYNGDNFDENNGASFGYGQNPPAVGCDFFEGPYQDPDGIDNVGPYFNDTTKEWSIPTVQEALDNNGIVYKGIGVGYSDGIPDNERYGMRLFTYYTNSAPPGVSDPTSAPQYYNYMSGLWADGQQMMYGGTGHPASSIPGITPYSTNYMFPGIQTPLHWATGGFDPGFDWSEFNTDGNGNETDEGDRRFVQSAGPFTLSPGAVNNITVGIVYGRGTGDAYSSVASLKRADTKAQALFDACFRILEPPSAPKLTIQELENELVLVLTNPISSNNHNELYYEEDEINIPESISDRFYTFEGYQIYQLIDDQASVSDIGDETKARLVAQCDIENDIEDIVNFEFDESLGFSMAKPKVKANNKGIQHSFLITEDEFALGNKRLINHKTYHYVAIAYAHNEYKKYDPNDPGALDGQKLPYIASRLSYDGGSIQSVSATPHNPSPEADGTIQQIAYGSGPLIRRLDGFGNGGRTLELTQRSKDLIVNNGYLENPVYDYGQGPINIKVIDPLNVVDGYFECLFNDYSVTTSNAADTASWTINRYDKEGGTLLETVTSDVAIGRVSQDPTADLISTNNEQIIPQWGVSVQITQSPYYLPPGATGGSEKKTTDLLAASLTFSDSSKRWLTGVPDNDGFYPTNWIRSGQYDPTHGTPEVSDDDCFDDTQPGYLDYVDPCMYPDELNVDPNKDWSGILGGTIAPHKLVGHQGSYMPLAYYNYSGSGAARTNASLSYLPSVDIVLTDDPTKWTRCPVIELGRSSELNVKQAEPGQMRKSQSVDQGGNPDNTGTTGMSWFPGYAIDVESGARLYMAFGENSFLVNDNGADMRWNPTDRMLDENNNPVMGGMHPIYVFSYCNDSKNDRPQSYDYPAYDPAVVEDLSQHVLYNDMLEIEAGNSAKKSAVYSSLTWVAYPLLEQSMSLLETDATIRLRVNKEYKDFSNISSINGGPNNGKPMYSWSMDDIRTVTGSADRLASVLDMINIVPNPYYAYSEYERNRLDTRVKITNLPERCNVKIYAVNGKLVRSFKKDSPITSLDWDLKNHKSVPVAGGVYLIHVEVPGIGERVLKFFGGTRQIDLHGT